MFQPSLRHLFSSFRVFNNLWMVQNDKWTLTADLTPAQHQLTQERKARIKYQSSLLISCFQTSATYQKGRKTEYYPLKSKDALELACWDLTLGLPYEFAHHNKALIIKQLQPPVPQTLQIIIYDRDLPEKDRRKVFTTSSAHMAALQNLIRSGSEQIWGVRNSQMSLIDQALDELHFRH